MSAAVIFFWGSVKLGATFSSPRSTRASNAAEVEGRMPWLIWDSRHSTYIHPWANSVNDAVFPTVHPVLSNFYPDCVPNLQRSVNLLGIDSGRNPIKPAIMILPYLDMSPVKKIWVYVIISSRNSHWFTVTHRKNERANADLWSCSRI